MIYGLNPGSATAGGGAFILSVIGTNFVPSSSVQWNGSDRPTTFISNTRLTAMISASDIAVPASATVAVYNPAPGGGSSVAIAFISNNPVPSITQINPSSALTGSTGFLLIVFGTRPILCSDRMLRPAAHALRHRSHNHLEH